MTTENEARAELLEALQYKAAAFHGISDEYVDLLGDEPDEPTLMHRAEILGGLIRAQLELEPLRAERSRLLAERAAREAQPPSFDVKDLRPGALPKNSRDAGDALYRRLFGN